MASIIVATSENGVIGVDNKLPWYLPEDLKRFKKLTENNVVIMGRKTYESIGKPLPNRFNIVISRNKDLTIPGCLVVNSLEKALYKAGSDKKVFIIGGGEIYRQSLEYVDKIYLTKVHINVEGDTTFPNIDDLPGWKLSDVDHKESFTYLEYVFEN